MTYPHAHKGVKKLFISELIAIVVSLLPFVGTILVNLDPNTPNGIMSDIGGYLAIAGLFGLIVVFILQLIGLIQAGRDESSFKIALFIILLSIVLGIVSPILTMYAVPKGLPSIVVTIIDTFKDISNVFVSIYVLIGISTLAGALNDEVMELKGRRLIYAISVLFFFSIMLVLVPDIISHFTTPSKTAQYIFFGLGLASSVAELLVYIFSLIYYGKSVKMLRK